MIRKRDKRGQGLSSETIIILVIAVIVLVIVVLGFTRGWDWVFGGFAKLPGDLEKTGQACGFAGENNLKTTYCNEFKEVKIAGKNQRVNCEYLAKNNYATFTTLTEACGSITKLAQDTCVNERLDDQKDMINGETCTVWKAKTA
ncbi:MAG: hypothetical protein AABW51_01190 [Nanoarchaeota archaeon]